LIEVSVILCLLVYIYAFPALWHYRRSAAGSAHWPALIACAIVATAVCLFVIIRAGTAQILLCASVVALTFPLYLLVKERARTDERETSPAITTEYRY
jgi:hypothetical protein